MKSRSVRMLRGLLGHGLLLAEGDLWLRQRRLVQPAFHRQRIAAYGEVMAALATRHTGSSDLGPQVRWFAELLCGGLPAESIAAIEREAGRASSEQRPPVAAAVLLLLTQPEACFPSAAA